MKSNFFKKFKKACLHCGKELPYASSFLESSGKTCSDCSEILEIKKEWKPLSTGSHVAGVFHIPNERFANFRDEAKKNSKN